MYVLMALRLCVPPRRIHSTKNKSKENVVKISARLCAGTTIPSKEHIHIIQCRLAGKKKTFLRNKFVNFLRFYVWPSPRISFRCFFIIINLSLLVFCAIKCETIASHLRLREIETEFLLCCRKLARHPHECGGSYEYNKYSTSIIPTLLKFN